MKRIVLIVTMLICGQSWAVMPLQFTALDSGYNTTHGEPTMPSMAQAMDLSMDFYNLSHQAWGTFSREHDFNENIVFFLFDIVWAGWPLSVSWVHEEYHRAVLGQEGINSYNGTYAFPTSDIISVSEVSDAELAKFKRSNPAGFARMSAAGMEAQTDMTLRIDQEQFFYGGRTQMMAQYLNVFGNIGYMHACLTGDERVDDFIAEEGKDVQRRDFTGFDCTAWAYDLHRPEEKYAARGEHPSGEGIDRYIKYADLTRQEKDYLIDNANLSFISMLNPFLIQKEKFRWNDDWWWNGTASYYMTSFGHAVDNNLFLLSDQYKFFFALHHYFNHSRYFPGLEAKFLDLPVNTQWLLDGRAMLWRQPEGQEFRNTDGALGGLVSAKFYYLVTPASRPFVEVEGKSQGWVAGNAALTPAAAMRIGYRYLY